MRFVCCGGPKQGKQAECSTINQSGQKKLREQLPLRHLAHFAIKVQLTEDPTVKNAKLMKSNGQKRLITERAGKVRSFNVSK